MNFQSICSILNIKRYASYILGIILILCGLSMTANIIFLLKESESFKKLQFSRIFPLGYISYENKIQGNSQATRLIFLGDSRSQMWDTSSLEADYGVINIGHGGQTSSQVLLQIKSNLFPEGKFVILQVGINDIHPIGAFRDLKPLIIKNCKENISEIVKHLKSEGYKTIATTLFPPYKIPISRWFFIDEQFYDIISDINNFIKNLADNRDIFVIDACNILRSNENILQEKYRDHDFFLHVNKDAYMVLNEELRKVIKNISSR